MSLVGIVSDYAFPDSGVYQECKPHALLSPKCPASIHVTQCLDGSVNIQHYNSEVNIPAGNPSCRVFVCYPDPRQYPVFMIPYLVW